MALALLVSLAGCATSPQNANPSGNLKDIHESLSTVVARNGFSHEIRSQRAGSSELDTIIIHIPLDSLKRRHSSLDMLMKDLGAVCVLPEYINLPVQIEIGPGDEEDRMYLKSALMPAIHGRNHLRVVMAPRTDTDIVITVRHPR